MKEPKLVPVNNRVIILPDTINDKLGEGILVKAETTKVGDRRKQTLGTLVAVSSCSFDELADKPNVGDRVEFAMYAGQFYMEDETEYRIMRDEDIVGILKQ